MSGMGVKKSLAWMGGTSLFGQVITWTVTIVVARLLSPEDYGIVAISGLYTVFAHTVCLMGVSAAVVQADEISDYQIRALYGFSILTGVIMFGIGLLAAPLMAWAFNDPRLTALVSFQNIVFLVGAPKSLQWSLLARETRFDAIAKIETGSRIITSFCALSMAAAGFGYWTLASQWILIEFFQLIGFSYYRPVRPTFLIRWAEVSELLLFGLKILARKSIAQLYSKVDVFIFGKLASPAFLGGYTFAKQLTNMPFEKIINIINRVLLPYLAKDKSDHERMREWTLKVSYLQVLFLVPFYYVLFFCAEEAILILLGESWAAAVLPLRIFCLMNIFKLAESYVMVALTALGRITEQVKFVFMQLVLVGGAILGISLWQGIEASLYVWITVYPVLCLLFSGILLKAIGLGIGTVFKRVRRTLAAQAFLIAALVYMQYVVEGPMWQTLIVKLAVAGGVYLTGLALLDRRRIMQTLDFVPAFRKAGIGG
jgi:O-antigen/teichoic acid export membrane protein